MKIALVQTIFKTADIKNNLNKIIEIIEELKNKDVKLIVFPELALSGGVVLDICEYKDFKEDNLYAISTLANQFKDISIIIGAYIPTEDISNNPYFNSAVFISSGKVQNIVAKTILNDTDINNESRYFKRNDCFKICELENNKFAIVISDDISIPAIYDEFEINPMNELIKHKPQFVICLGNIAFDFEQHEIRQNIISLNAARYETPFIFVNSIGCNTQIIFDGGSMVSNKNGNIVEMLETFNEEIKIIDTNLLNSMKNVDIIKTSKIETIHKALIFGIQQYFKTNGFTKAILGLSGGIDSAVVASLLVEALGNKNVSVILMPSQFSSEHSISDALELANNLEIESEIISIENIYEQFVSSFNNTFNDLPFSVAEENLQARIRAVILMSYSNKFNSILVNTSNKSEASVGYGTMYGDLCGSISVLGDLYKTEVYDLAHFINKNKIIIPKNIITKEPSAELRNNQKDSDSLPEYSILDKILKLYVEESLSEDEILQYGYDEIVVKKIVKLIKQNEFKRFQAPPIIRVSSKAFGSGKLMPL